MRNVSLIVLAFSLIFTACGPQGGLDGKVYDQNNPSANTEQPPVQQSLQNCENAVAGFEPFSSCGVYDSSNQTVCSCYRPSQNINEMFFKSDSDLDHWRSVYPSVVVIFSGASPYDNTGQYTRSIKTQ